VEPGLQRAPERPPTTVIGLFGGSFNPVHLGHLLVAQAACEELGLAALYFIPAAQSPFKPAGELAPAADRLRLLRLALAGKCQYLIDDQELVRGGISYTIDTVRRYRAQFPAARLIYMIGADHVALLPKWRAAEELAADLEFAVIPRPGVPTDAVPAPFRGRSLQGFPLRLSSSEIRTRVRAGQSIEHLVPAPVAESIRNYHLYL
jgi:nicotinate-nucleotide adenylyltransferase